MHPFKITDELVDDTLCTALEGGITYWAVGAEQRSGPANPTSKMFPGEPAYASELLTMGGSLDIIVDESLVDDDVVKEHNLLTLTAMKRGIRKYCEIRKTTPAKILDDPLDAGEADVVVQLALFGDIIFD